MGSLGKHLSNQDKELIEAGVHPTIKVIDITDKLKKNKQSEEDKLRKEAIDRLIEQAKKLTW